MTLDFLVVGLRGHVHCVEHEVGRLKVKRDTIFLGKRMIYMVNRWKQSVFYFCRLSQKSRFMNMYVHALYVRNFRLKQQKNAQVYIILRGDCYVYVYIGSDLIDLDVDWHSSLPSTDLCASLVEGLLSVPFLSPALCFRQALYPGSVCSIQPCLLGYPQGWSSCLPGSYCSKNSSLVVSGWITGTTYWLQPFANLSGLFPMLCLHRLP